MELIPFPDEGPDGGSFLPCHIFLPESNGDSHEANSTSVRVLPESRHHGALTGSLELKGERQHTELPISTHADRTLASQRVATMHEPEVRKELVAVARQGEWPVLEGLDALARTRLLQRATRRKFDRHEVVFHESDPGDTFHLIEQGLVEIQITTPLGDVATLAILGRGDFFGELALLLPGGRRTATARALEPVQTWMINREAFEELCREHPAVARFLTNALAIKVRDLSAQVVDALYVPADRRVLRRLLDVVDVFRRDAEGLVVTLTQDDLASLAGTARPTVNHVLKKAEQAGLVSVGRGHVTILDYEGLVRKAR